MKDNGGNACKKWNEKTLNSVLGHKWTLYTPNILLIHLQINLDEWNDPSELSFILTPKEQNWQNQVNQLVYLQHKNGYFQSQNWTICYVIVW